MGKRSDFERRANDLYPTTDPRAVAALLPHLPAHVRFAEPCAGDGALLDQLVAAGHVCVWASDIAPLRGDVVQADALTLDGCAHAEVNITNPPWTREILHALIVHLSDRAPTWLLFDADWKHTRQAAPLMPRLRRIVSIGRLRWEPGTPYDGKDNCAWYLFDRPSDRPAEFYGRAA